MNCTPGQPAMIVRDTAGGGTCFTALIGTPLTVDKLVSAEGERPMWSYRGRTLRCPMCGVGYLYVYDADLHPLPPPPAPARTTGVDEPVDTTGPVVAHEEAEA